MVDRRLTPDGPAEGTDVLAVLADGRRAGSFFLVQMGETTVHLRDLLLADPADAPQVREQVVALLRDRGTTTLSVGVDTGDRAAEAFIADAGFQLIATQMQLDLGTTPTLEAGEVMVRPMTADELAAYFAHAVEGFAEETMAADRSLTKEAALTNSREIHEQILPQGLETPGHDFLMALAREDGRRLGLTWLFHEERAGYVYDVEVDEAERGKGYGRALMEATADHVRGLGMEVLGLNVFGHNQVAMGLYASLGYDVVERLWNLKVAQH
jgi:GNAT superfamily N-acetyltransferase